ncbi:hypothetical protein [Stenotrophomonas sp. PS02297]|uniref:hypothetical protein n=1 Tax=Stenotrophomonas sp. PS02297 TaxID=2991423 RepID=UPI00249BE03E|nr:hypothetical protein [Stenotrophomonas sp. PS02297]
MSAPRSAPTPGKARLLTGGLLLAFWLGWAAMALAHLQPPSWRAGDLADAERSLAHLLGRLPAGSEQAPLAIRLAPGCACSPEGDGDPAWRTLATAMQAADGQAIATEVEDGTHEVMILATGHRLVYAGPLVPDPALCGNGPPATRLRQWLPQLLARTGTALVGASCACTSPRRPSSPRLPLR